MSTISDLVLTVRSAALPKAADQWTMLEADTEARSMAQAISDVQEEQRVVSHQRYALRAQLAKLAGFEELDYADARAGAVAMDVLSKAAAEQHPELGAELADLGRQADLGLGLMRERAIELGAVVRASYPALATFWIGPMLSRHFHQAEAGPSMAESDRAADALRLKQIETLGFIAMLTLLNSTPPLTNTAGLFKLDDPPKPEHMERSRDAYMRHIEMCGFTAVNRREVKQTHDDVFYDTEALEAELAELSSLQP